jgi:hypothetical protein
MGSPLSEILGESVRALVEAQIDLDRRAADVDRWDREGLPPVALSYTGTRLVLTTLLRAHASVRTCAVALVTGQDFLGPIVDGHREPACVIGVTIRLKPQTTHDPGKENDDGSVDLDRPGPAGQ